MTAEADKSKLCGIGQFESSLRLKRANGVFQSKAGRPSFIQVKFLSKNTLSIDM